MKRRTFIAGILGAAISLGLAQGVGAAPSLPTSTTGQSTALQGDLHHGRGSHIHGLLTKATATVTGLTLEQVRTELQAGKTLAQIAESKGKTSAQVIASARASLKTKLDQEVKDGKKTQAQADQVLADFDAKAAQAMTSTAPQKPANTEQRGVRRGMHRLVEATASMTALTEQQLRTELRAGKSLAQVAEAKGKTAAEVIAKARTSFKADLDKAVSAGTITQAQADQALVTFDSEAPQAMQKAGGPGEGHGRRQGERGPRNGTNSATPTPAPTS